MYSLIEISVEILFFYLIYELIKNKIKLVNRSRLLLLVPLFSLLIIASKQLFLAFSEFELIEFVELDLIEISSLGKSMEDSWFRWEYFYLVGFIISLFSLGIKLLKINNFFKKLNFEYKNGIKIFQSDKADSFTFFNMVHLNSKNYEASSIIEEHERIHVEKKHTIKLMLMEFYQLFFWFNPVIYLIKYELKRTQEYQVDKIMFKKYGIKYI